MHFHIPVLDSNGCLSKQIKNETNVLYNIKHKIKGNFQSIVIINYKTNYYKAFSISKGPSMMLKNNNNKDKQTYMHSFSLLLGH